MDRNYCKLNNIYMYKVSLKYATIIDHRNFCLADAAHGANFARFGGASGPPPGTSAEWLPLNTGPHNLQGM